MRCSSHSVRTPFSAIQCWVRFTIALLYTRPLKLFHPPRFPLVLPPPFLGLRLVALDHRSLLHRVLGEFHFRNFDLRSIISKQQCPPQEVQQNEARMRVKVRQSLRKRVDSKQEQGYIFCPPSSPFSLSFHSRDSRSRVARFWK